jgi:hypothetical protein
VVCQQWINRRGKIPELVESVEAGDHPTITTEGNMAENSSDSPAGGDYATSPRPELPPPVPIPESRWKRFRRHFLNRSSLCFSLALVIIGAIQARIYYIQSGTMTSQLKEMTAQRLDSEALQAPILAAINPEMWPYDSDNISVAKTSPRIASWGVSPGIKNVGTTRATHFRMGSKVDIEPLIGGFPDQKDWKKSCPAYTSIDDSKEGLEAVLPPGDGNGRIAPAESLTLDKAILNAKHQESVVFIVYAVYQDIFNTKIVHHFYRCEWIVANNPQTSEFSMFVVDEKSD